MTRLQKLMEAQIEAIKEMKEGCDTKYGEIIEVLSKCHGKVVFMGVGKSGHIGKKLAATFSSTGTPSFFVHSTESVHGDLGMIQKCDIAVLISNSGNTREVVQTIDGLKRIGCTIIAFTSGKNSDLAQKCDYALLYPNCGEADHLGLAPTISSTLTLILGDAIACELSERKDFTKDDFYGFHPAGALGQKLGAELKK